MKPIITNYLANILTLDSRDKLVYWKSGTLSVDQHGAIQYVGPKSKAPRGKICDISDFWILPGLIDSHTHPPQLAITGSMGHKLLAWLDRYTFPEEIKFKSSAYSSRIFAQFFAETLSAGTTTSVCFGPPFLEPTHEMFKAAEKAGLRLIGGKTAMDREVPRVMRATAESEATAFQALVGKWHGKHNRLFVAATPRFAISCSRKLMSALAEQVAQTPGAYIQTHFAESRDEIAAVKRMFPRCKSYLDAYEDVGLLQNRIILAHSVYPTKSEIKRLSTANALISHCPTSNMFLGSGLFSSKDHDPLSSKISLGTDIGAGTSPSIWQTMTAAYQVQKLQDITPSPVQILAWATTSPARFLGIPGVTGRLEAGAQADFQVIDINGKFGFNERIASARSEADILSCIIASAGAGCIRATYVDGRLVHGSLPH